MPGWALGNLVIGIIVGMTFRQTKYIQNNFLKTILNFIAIAISTALGILIFKSLAEHILYSQPMIIRMSKNIFAFAADIFVLEISLPICMSLDKTIKAVI